MAEAEQEQVTREEPYNEENDATTPYLNPGYRIELYENTWWDILVIACALILFWGCAFGYFMLYFGPISAGVVYHYNMWWAFLIIFGLSAIVIGELITNVFRPLWCLLFLGTRSGASSMKRLRE